VPQTEQAMAHGTTPIAHRTLIADAAFGQVRAVVALREHGLYMICNVKMCHKFFPKAELNQGEDPPPTTTTPPSTPMAAAPPSPSRPR
jgi:hypothetical protein